MYNRKESIMIHYPWINRTLFRYNRCFITDDFIILLELVLLNDCNDTLINRYYLNIHLSCIKNDSKF